MAVTTAAAAAVGDLRPWPLGTGWPVRWLERSVVEWRCLAMFSVELSAALDANQNCYSRTTDALRERWPSFHDASHVICPAEHMMRAHQREVCTTLRRSGHDPAWTYQGHAAVEFLRALELYSKPFFVAHLSSHVELTIFDKKASRRPHRHDVAVTQATSRGLTIRLRNCCRKALQRQGSAPPSMRRRDGGRAPPFNYVWHLQVPRPSLEEWLRLPRVVQRPAFKVRGQRKYIVLSTKPGGGSSPEVFCCPKLVGKIAFGKSSYKDAYELLARDALHEHFCGDLARLITKSL